MVTWETTAAEAPLGDEASETPPTQAADDTERWKAVRQRATATFEAIDSLCSKDGQVSREELLRVLQQERLAAKILFKELDENSDGGISMVEWQHWFTVLGKSSIDEAESRLEWLEERISNITTPRSEELQPGVLRVQQDQEREAAIKRRAEEAFYAIDALCSKDGEVSREELLRVLRQEKLAAKVLFKELDENADGGISLKEWQKWFTSLSMKGYEEAESRLEWIEERLRGIDDVTEVSNDSISPGVQRAAADALRQDTLKMRATAAFEAIDAQCSRDGEVSLKELIQVLRQERLAAKVLFKELDENADGGISLVEWLKWFEKLSMRGYDEAESRLEWIEERLSAVDSDAKEISISSFSPGTQKVAEEAERRKDILSRARQTFETIDSQCSRDGEVSLEELLKVLRQERLVAKVLFKELDVNSDGGISLKEWMSWFNYLLRHGGLEEAESRLEWIEERIASLSLTHSTVLSTPVHPPKDMPALPPAAPLPRQAALQEEGMPRYPDSDVIEVRVMLLENVPLGLHYVGDPKTRAIRILSFVPGSPCDHAGVVQGVLKKVDGVPVHTESELVAAIQSLRDRKAPSTVFTIAPYKGRSTLSGAVQPLEGFSRELQERLHGRGSPYRSPYRKPTVASPAPRGARSPARLGSPSRIPSVSPHPTVTSPPRKPSPAVRAASLDHPSRSKSPPMSPPGCVTPPHRPTSPARSPSPQRDGEGAPPAPSPKHTPHSEPSPSPSRPSPSPARRTSRPATSSPSVRPRASSSPHRRSVMSSSPSSPRGPCFAPFGSNTSRNLSLAAKDPSPSPASYSPRMPKPASAAYGATAIQSGQCRIMPVERSGPGPAAYDTTGSLTRGGEAYGPFRSGSPRIAVSPRGNEITPIGSPRPQCNAPPPLSTIQVKDRVHPSLLDKQARIAPVEKEGPGPAAYDVSRWLSDGDVVRMKAEGGGVLHSGSPRILPTKPANDTLPVPHTSPPPNPRGPTRLFAGTPGSRMKHGVFHSRCSTGVLLPD